MYSGDLLVFVSLVQNAMVEQACESVQDDGKGMKREWGLMILRTICVMKD